MGKQADCRVFQRTAARAQINAVIHAVDAVNAIIHFYINCIGLSDIAIHQGINCYLARFDAGYKAGGINRCECGIIG